MNKALLIGHLGRDPEHRTFPDGGTVANASIATSERWKDKQTGEQREATEWHNLVFNGRQAEIAAQYLRKGAHVFVEGKIRTRKWQDKNGQDRYTTEILVLNFQMLDKKGDVQTAAAAPEQTPRTQAEIEAGARAYAAASGGTVPAQPPALPQRDGIVVRRPAPAQAPAFDSFEDDVPF